MTSTIDTGEFRERCDRVGGITQFAEDGILLSCVAEQDQISVEPLVVYFNEVTPTTEELAAINVSIADTENNRLAVYFATVYNGTPYDQWNKMAFIDLRELYLSLDMYYLFPSTIRPNTPIPMNRPSGEPTFYRVPDDVAMRQRYLYNFDEAIPNEGTVEVIHFGNLNTELPNVDPELFAGTYYYRAKGSGVALDVGRKTLIAWNKVDALHTMQIPNETIYQESGQSFKDSVATVQKLRGLTFDGALNVVVEAMSQGSSIRYDPQTKRYVYFGLGDQGDNFLAQQAVSKGYTSIQLVREAQAAPNARVASVGYEIIDLKPPVESSNSLLVDLILPLN